MVRQDKTLDLKGVISTIRIKQWVKNIIIPVSGLASIGIYNIDLNDILNLMLSFLSFCFAASSIYIFNDLIDVEKDKAHPKKKNRAIASGKISLPLAGLIFIAFIILSLSIAYLIGEKTSVLLIAYLLINIAYCVKLKNIPQIDIVCVASGFTIRALTGAYAVKQDIDFWILGAITFSCMALVIMKRMKEIKQLGSSGETRSVLSGYTYDVLLRKHDIFLVLSVFSFIIYLDNSFVDNTFIKAIALGITSVMLMIFIERIHNNVSGDPTEFFYANKYLSLSFIAIIFGFLALSATI